MLDERKAFILKAVVQDYITEGVPVGSGRLVGAYHFPASSATVRNSMAELENEGYLTQPHHSSGRIPTDKGYRFYVDSLMTCEKLSLSTKKQIQREYDQRFNEIEEILYITSKILAHISGCAAIVQAPSLKRSVIKHIEILSIDEGKVLLILLTNTNTVINRMIEVPSSVAPSDLEQITSILNAKLTGIFLDQINLDLLDDWKKELFEVFFQRFLEAITKIIEEELKSHLYVDGMSNLLEKPECHDISRIKPVIHLLEKENKLCKAIGFSSLHEMTGIRIGHENPLKELKEFSIIVSPYYLDNNHIGNIGILGPTRLPYGKLIPMVRFIATYVTGRITLLY